MRGRGSTTGSTLIESMIAMSVFVTAAVATYPLLIKAKEQNKASAVQRICQNAVQTKLNQYRRGRAINLFAEVPVGSPYEHLRKLSFPTLGQQDLTNPVASGFMYAKYRYNRYYKIDTNISGAYCRAMSNASIFTDTGLPASLTTPARQIGLRECIGSELVWKDDQAIPDPGCSAGAGNPPTLDDLMAKEIPNFKLYVKLELDTPWPLTLTGFGSNDPEVERYDNSCPNANAGIDDNHPIYDFDGYGDGIRVTVTGVIDIPKNGTFAGLNRENLRQVMCMEKDVLRPPSPGFRYYLKSNKIYSTLKVPDATTGVAQDRQVFQTIAPGAVSAFFVHPRNAAVYMLRNGSISRYTGCGGVPLDCNVSAIGISDFGGSQGTTTHSFALPVVTGLNWASFGLDFTRKKAFAINDVGALFLLAPNGKTTADFFNLTDYGPPNNMNIPITASVLSAGGADFFVWDTTTYGTPSSYSRDPGSTDDGDFFVVFQTSTAPFCTGGCTAVYRSSDLNKGTPMTILPDAATAFSR